MLCKASIKYNSFNIGWSGPCLCGSARPPQWHQWRRQTQHHGLRESIHHPLPLNSTILISSHWTACLLPAFVRLPCLAHFCQAVLLQTLIISVLLLITELNSKGGKELVYIHGIYRLYPILNHFLYKKKNKEHRKKAYLTFVKKKIHLQKLFTEKTIEKLILLSLAL